MKRWIAAACAACMLAGMTGCTQQATGGDYSGQTLTGQVQQVADGKITLLLGEWSEAAGGTPPETPGEGETPTDAAGETPPEQPGGRDETGDPPEMPEGQAPGEGATPSYGEGETPPDLPSGQTPEGGAAPDGGAGGTPPELPQGQMPQDGEPGGMGGSFTAGEETVELELAAQLTVTREGMAGQASSVDDLAQGDIVQVTVGQDNAVSAIVVKNINGGPGGGFGGSDQVTNGTAAQTIDQDTQITGGTFTSTGDDENALRIDGATVTLQDITVEKSGGASSNTENGDFYGMNAGLLALNGATVEISGATIDTAAQNGNGVFSYGEGTTVNIADSVIRTSADNSGGIQTTGGGTTNASNLDVQTQGNSAAAIRSDRGGGTVQVSGGRYETNGTGSPAIYSTADIAVNGATLVANNSEAVVVEGKNSVALTDCEVTGSMAGTYRDGEENIHNIMIYQSMSGDADVGHASFSATGGSITAQAGDMFYVTNTSCTIALERVALNLANDTLLTVAGNSSSRGWGTQGQNGGQATLNATSQQLSGKITVDAISTLAMNLSGNSRFEGCINPDGQGGTVNVTIDAGSTWVLTADSYVTSLENAGSIDYNGYTLYLADGTALTD